MQEFWVLWRMGSISWRKTLEILHNSIHWLIVNTRFRVKEEHHNRKDGFRETHLHGKHGVEIRILSLSRDNTHFWVRISHWSKKFVMNLINKETEILEDQFEEYALQLNAQNFACRAEAKAKPQRTEFDGSSPRIGIERRNWIDIVPGKYFLSEYEVSKNVIHIFRHSQQVHREEDGAVHFWRVQYWNLFFAHPPAAKQTVQRSSNLWIDCRNGFGRFCFVDMSGTIVYFRVFQGHSGHNFFFYP